MILAPAHLPAGRAVLHCQTWAPCPALLLTGPEGEGPLPNLLQTVWSPGLPLSRPLGPLPYRGRPLSCSAGTEFLALG